MNKTKSHECEIVQDLLPLYYDDVCSPSSKKLVQNHLANCESCRNLYEELKNDSVDRIMEKETHGVLERHARKERTAAFKAGLIISILLVIPIMITLLVSLSSGGGLGVFSVVAASMLLIAALTVVPLMSRQKRTARSILAGIIALLLIIFFVDRMNGGGNFILIAVPTVFGLSVPLFPFIIRGLDLPLILSDKKALITMIWDTAWLFLTIFVICNHYGDVEGLRSGNIISVILMTGIWIIFLTIRYLPSNMFVKSGIVMITAGIWTTFSNDAYTLLAEHEKQLTILSANFHNWSSNVSINANIYLILLASCTVIGILLLLYGISKHQK